MAARIDYKTELAGIKQAAAQAAQTNTKVVQTGDISVRTTASPLVKACFYAAEAILFILTAIDIVAGTTEHVTLYLLAIILGIAIFFFLSNSRAYFAVEGIQQYRRTLWWDDVKDLSIDRKNRIIYIESRDGYIRKIRVQKKEPAETYDRIAEFSRRMLTMAAARAVAKGMQ